MQPDGEALVKCTGEPFFSDLFLPPPCLPDHSILVIGNSIPKDPQMENSRLGGAMEETGYLKYESHLIHFHVCFFYNLTNMY